MTVDATPLWPLKRQTISSARPGILWSTETRSLIESGTVLPIVSNYLLPRVFGVTAADLAQAWARDINSPLTDQENRDLARVAQFYAVREKSLWKARVEYHNVLKGYLLSMASRQGEADQEYLDELTSNPDKLETTSFSSIARALDYPRFEDASRNPLRLLAELPLPIYLTTCQHEFLEIALERTESRHPVSEVFYWDDSQRVIPSIYDTEPNYRPSRERPLVYHLFGMDRYPASMVVSEEDYLSVLMRFSELKRSAKVGEYDLNGNSAAKYDLPVDLKLSLTSSGLLLLGYTITDWEFRALFRWLVKYIGPSRAGQSSLPDAFSIQVQPGAGSAPTERTRDLAEYLTNFFGQNNFSVYWGDPEGCVHELYARWKGA